MPIPPPLARPQTRPYSPAVSPENHLSVRTLAAVYRRTAPWVLAVWAIDLLIPGPPAQQILLNLGASIFYGAATARALGLHADWSVPALAVDRAFSHLTSLTTLVVLTAFAAGIGATLGAMAAHAAGLPDQRLLSIPSGALAALPILWWHWPAIILAYMVPEQFGIRLKPPRAWRGPRYGDARRLARAAGDAGTTAVLLGFALLWLVLSLTVDHPTLATAVHAASYLLFIPILLTMAAVETLRMLHRATADQDS